jgi:hypothetical protein
LCNLYFYLEDGSILFLRNGDTYIHIYIHTINYMAVHPQNKYIHMIIATARMGEGRGAYRILVGRPEGRRPLGRPRRRWEDNVKMDVQEMGWGGHGLD